MSAFVQTARLKHLLGGEVQTTPCKLWHGSVAEVWLGCFKPDESSVADLTDYEDIAEFQFEVYSNNYPSGVLLFSKSVLIANVNKAMTEAEWIARTDASIKFSFTSADLNLEFSGSVGRYQYVVFAVPEVGERQVMISGEFLLLRNQASNGGYPPGPPDNYYTIAEVDELLTELAIDITESPYVIVDTEAELTTALLKGQWILLRGEGTGGIIPITSQKDIVVRGTKILGYGYRPGVTGYFARLKANWATLPAYGATFAPIILHVGASNVEIAGFEIEGRDANDLVTKSYVAIYISPFFALDDVQVRDMAMWNLYRGITRWGFAGCSFANRLIVENCYIHSTTNSGIGLQQNVRNSLFYNNHVVPRLEGQPATFPDAQGFTITAGIYHCVIDSNIIENANRMGMEFTSVAISTGNFSPMYNNKYVNNRIKTTGSIGMSVAYGIDSLIHGNTIDGATGCGIESTGGSVLGESLARHNSTITSNAIRNIASGHYSNGISCDQSFGDIISGNVIENVASSVTGVDQDAYARGLMLYRTRNALVTGNRFQSVNGIGIFGQGAGIPIEEAQAVINNNTFRVLHTDTKALYALRLQAMRAVVLGNASWEPASQLAQGKFLVQFNAGSHVNTGVAGNFTTDGFFTDSNLVLQYGATIAPPGALVDEFGNYILDQYGNFITG